MFQRYSSSLKPNTISTPQTPLHEIYYSIAEERNKKLPWVAGFDYLNILRDAGCFGPTTAPQPEQFAQLMADVEDKIKLRASGVAVNKLFTHLFELLTHFLFPKEKSPHINKSEIGSPQFTEMLFEYLRVATEHGVCDELRKVAQSLDPSVSEKRVDIEVFVFLHFLLLQACKQIFSDAASLRRLGEQQNAFRQRMGKNHERASFIKLQETRYWEYLDPFEADMERLREDPPGAIHWRFLVEQFMKNFNPEPKIEDVDGTIPARLSVGTAFIGMLRFVKDYGSA